MIKAFLRSFFITTVILFIVAWFVPSVDLGYPVGTAFNWHFFIAVGIPVLITSGLFLAFLFVILRPILKLLGAPINFLTMGLFNVAISAFFFWLANTFVPGFDIHPLAIAGHSLGMFGTYLAIAVVFGFVEGFVTIMF